MPQLYDERILLLPLKDEDATGFYHIYTDPGVCAFFEEDPLVPGESPLDFLLRIKSYCTHIWTIRLQEAPGTIIGDVALHDADEALSTTEIGGSLFPEYQGKGLMTAAFRLVLGFVKEELNVKQVLGRTHPANTGAIRLVEKLGFHTLFAGPQEVVLTCNLSGE